MEKLIELRSEIYDHFHSSQTCANHFFDKENHNEYSLYYTSMYLLQDSLECTFRHTNKGFSNNSMDAYIEMLGIMQAINIQQDSISCLYNIFINKNLEPSKRSKWYKIRRLRNQCAGHPHNHQQKYRSFFGRNGISYNNLQYERKYINEQEPEHICINYKELINQYAAEAEIYLTEILETMRKSWP